MTASEQASTPATFADPTVTGDTMTSVNTMTSSPAVTADPRGPINHPISTDPTVLEKELKAVTARAQDRYLRLIRERRDRERAERQIIQLQAHVRDMEIKYSRNIRNIEIIDAEKLEKKEKELTVVNELLRLAEAQNVAVAKRVSDMEAQIRDYLAGQQKLIETVQYQNAELQKAKDDADAKKAIAEKDAFKAREEGKLVLRAFQDLQNREAKAKTDAHERLQEVNIMKSKVEKLEELVLWYQSHNNAANDPMAEASPYALAPSPTAAKVDSSSHETFYQPLTPKQFPQQLQGMGSPASGSRMPMNAPAYSPSPVSAKLATTMASSLNFRTQATMNMNMASPVNLAAHAPMNASNSSPLSMSTPSPFNTTAPLTHVPSPSPFRMTNSSPMMNAAAPMRITASSPVMTTASPAMPFASSPQLPIFQRAQTPYNLPTNNQSPVFMQSPAMTLQHGTITPEDILRSAGTPPQRDPAAKMIACLNCHLNWWNEDCDCGEPCANCKILGVNCERPPCANFQAGECRSKGRCTRAHEGDGYANLACFRKDLKRKGKMSDQHKIAPCRQEMGGPQQ